jgi:death-on-curing protein
VSRLVIDAIHADQLKVHGGSPGLRDENALESALARPRQKWEYGNERDPAVLAAAYGFGLVRNHPYQDGNKRVGFLAIATFLGINGHELHATDEEVVTTMFALASGDLDENGLTRSIRTWMRRPAGPLRQR